MGRAVKRVPLDFDWPMSKIWKGYDPINSCGKIPVCDCRQCPLYKTDCSEEEKICIYYPDNYKIWYFDPPQGPGFQMWEDTSEGSPISPVFETPEELAKWLADTGASSFGDSTATYEQWFKMIKSYGYSVGLVIDKDGMKSGVEAR